MTSNWTLTVFFAPVSNQGWEEQNPGEDFASRVLQTVKRQWEYDDEVSNDFEGRGFDGEIFWQLTEDRTFLLLTASVLDQLEDPLSTILTQTIPLTLTLTNIDYVPLP